MATISKKTALKTSGNQGYNPMPKEMQDKLLGKSLNQAIAEGLITDLGDAAGNLFAISEKDYRYALVNGFRVGVSSKLQDAEASEILEQLGDLTFNGGISNQAGEGFGKYWFNLGMPRTMALSAEEGINVNAGTEEPAVA